MRSVQQARLAVTTGCRQPRPGQACRPSIQLLVSPSGERRLDTLEPHFCTGSLPKQELNGLSIQIERLLPDLRRPLFKIPHRILDRDALEIAEFVLLDPPAKPCQRPLVISFCADRVNQSVAMVAHVAPCRAQARGSPNILPVEPLRAAENSLSDLQVATPDRVASGEIRLTEWHSALQSCVVYPGGVGTCWDSR